MRGNALGDAGRDDSSNLCDTGRTKLCDAAKAPQQLLRRPRTNAGNIFETGLNRALGAALAMESHGKPVRLVANLLN